MKSEMDNNEWAGEEMSLERFTKNNPFTVPSGYFDEAGQRILSLVKLDELKGFDAAAGFSVPANYFDELQDNITGRLNIEAVADATQPGFAVPENYFDQLTASITSRINIDVEAEQPEFTVPEGYFDQLTAGIQSRIAIEEAAGTDMGFNIPQGYFEDMQQQVTARIAVEEALEATPAAFTVPEGYFDQLNRNILNKTVNKNAVLRKSIVRKLWATNTFKYATAACLALIIGTGVFLRESGSTIVVPEHQKTVLHTQLSTIPVNEIKDYLELHVDATDNHGIMDDDKNINTQALDEDLSDYVDVN